MREIKFRAKAINRDPNIEYRTNYENGDWVYGLITDLPIETSFGTSPATMTNENGISGIEIDFETLGQYIGAKDVNEVEIYEGDIVKSNGKLHVVSYDEYCAQFLFCNDEEDMGYGNLFIVEVVGNVYDNPELLEEMQ